jgi:ABC-type polysaccharide/polyol phosphate export permease
MTTITNSAMPLPGLLRYFSEVKENREVLYQLVRQQITLRYRRTVLGYLWTLLNPLLMMSVTAVVFSALFHMKLEEYAVFLFSGVVAFNLFGTIVTNSGQALIGNEGLIKKVYVPKILFPLSIAFAMLIDNVLMFLSLFVIVLAIGGKVSPALVTILPSYVLLFFFSFGFALVFSVIAVYFRDLQHIIGVLMQALVFLSPVYYKPETLASRVQAFIQLNPLTEYILLFRAPVYSATYPPASAYGWGALYAVLSMAFGLWFFSRHEHRVTFRM